MRSIIGRGGRGAAGATVTVACAAVAAMALAPSGSGAGGGTIGSSGVGDPFFPKSGNGGYDVSHYEVSIAYEPKRNIFRPVTRTVLEAEVTQPAGLTRFNLDFRGLKVTDLKVIDADTDAVYGEDDFSRDGQELTIDLDSAMPLGTDFLVFVHYRGKPKRLTDPDGSLEGWVKTGDGAISLGEPRGTPTWIPSNDHPTDKATFAIEILVPKGFKAVSNGELVESNPSPNGKRRLFAWEEVQPMATYLATATVGKFDVIRETLPGAPSYSYTAVDRKLDRGATDRGPEIIDYLDDSFGAYPFDETGAIVDRGAEIGYALETQTRPFYPSPPGDGLVAHELAHQWFGNQVSLADWSEIWLNEGFAQWAQWYWVEHDGGPAIAGRVNDLCEIPAGDSGFWNPPPATVPGPEVMFDDTVYERGAMTLQRLREWLGDPDFFNLISTWAGQDPLGSVTTDELIDSVKSISSESDGDIDDFFADWAYDNGKPDGCTPP
ncbi:MAG: M1 family metallopeptidase [bacterium]